MIWLSRLDRSKDNPDDQEKYSLTKKNQDIFFEVLKWQDIRSTQINSSYDTVQPCDTTQARSNLNFGVKFYTVQFYAIKYNSKSNRWIELKIYQKIPEALVYVRVKLQMNQCSKRTCNIGQNRLYEFCYLLSFGLWTFYLEMILFRQGCGSLFWEFPSSTRIVKELQYNLQATQGKKG